MTNDWYRQAEWTPDAALEFERRLARSRGQRKEYLRIQALTLADSSSPEDARAAITLARRQLDGAETGIHAAQMHATMAKAAATLGDNNGAIEAYRCAVDLEAKRPNVRGYHYIDYAWFASVRGLSFLFDEVLTAIERNWEKQDLMFPFNRYRYFGSLALIAASQGDETAAQQMARQAMASVAKEKGPLPGFPLAGRVGRGRDEVRERLERLAGQEVGRGEP
ncbi:hypothetical protein [Roseateles paludis]|jgi:hypothetical protein|uniref:Tetratricopeptide repeat protein n=1 Tax=Roseateles paludis TaxID=3145238 RepID=A0ABV0G1U2_9BURK